MVTTRDAETDAEQTARGYRNWTVYEDSEADPEPFKDLIQKDPVVCDHCFNILYSRISKEWWRGSFGWSDFEQWIPFPDKVEDIPADDDPGLRLTCSNCGHRGTKHRPVPKEDVVDFAENLSETLDAKEIVHDRDVLIEEAKERNTSDNQGKQDSHVFAPAVAVAIETVQ